MTTNSLITTATSVLVALAGACVSAARADVITVTTNDAATLAGALQAGGLVIDQLVVRQGEPGQIGTYSNFTILPVSINDGIVMSSGSVASIGPLAEAQDPSYQPSSPPSVVTNAMSPTGGGTPEFDAYADDQGNIHNFDASYDVAAIEVHFTLAAPSQVQFDFIFGSVEFPYWTNRFTDAFLVFLDGTTPNDQITFDNNGKPVQVGRSFAGLETSADLNTAFAAPHGLIHHLTTTTATLSAGPHTLIFEVGDVNDQILDSAVFISRLRLGSGDEGTNPSEDCPADVAGDNSDNNGQPDPDGGVDIVDLLHFLDRFEQGDAIVADVDDGSGQGRRDGGVDINDLLFFLHHFELGC